MRVSSPTSQLAIRPGGHGDLAVDVINTDAVIDGITARIIGLPAKSVQSRPAMLPLFPDASGQITLAIDLPETFPAGTHPLTVEVASRQPEIGSEYVNVDVTVPQAPAIEVVGRPETVRARRTGRFIAAVTNRGNVALDVDISVDDPQKACSIEVVPRSVSLAPGEAAEAVVTVRGRRIWMGTEQDRALRILAGARPIAPGRMPARFPNGEYDDLRGDSSAPLPGGSDAPAAETTDATTVLAAVPAASNAAAGLAVDGATAGSTAGAAADGSSVDGAADEAAPAAPPLQAGAPITFRQRPYLTRGLLTALILLAIIAVWAAVFLFGLAKVFAGDPLTKEAPASFFAATPAANAAANGGAAGSGTAGSGAAGAGGAGAAGSGAAGAAGASGGAAPAGALPKSGTLPAGVGGAISGTVTSASSGEPVPRILVTALRVKSDGSTVPAASAATQADGTYQVAGLFPGPYELKFAAPGFRTTYFPSAATQADAKQLTATTGGVATGGNAVVIGMPASITGSVDFGDTTTPTTATVSARLLGKSTGAKVVIPDVKTAANGTYTFKNLPAPGTYVLTITTKGYETATTQTTLTGGANRFVSATVLSAGNAQIAGTVTDGTAPLGGATVAITVNGQQQTTGTPTVGQVGHFAIGNLPTPATYILTVSKEGYGQVSQVIDLGPSGQQGDLTIALTAGTGIVSGTVTGINGAPVGGATVTAGGLTNPPTTTTLTDAPVGTFRLEGLPVPGSYTITVTAPGYAPQTVPVTLAADTVLPPITVPLTPSMGVITGVVTGANGAGIAGVAVSVTDGVKVWPVVTTSASPGTPAGSFTVAGLAAGHYTITATALDAAGNPQSVTTLADVTPGKPVSVSLKMGG